MSPQEEELYGGIVDADDFPHNFKEYVQTELYCLKEDDIYGYGDMWVFWSRNDGRPEISPPNYGGVADCRDFISETSRDSTSFNENIRALFMDFLPSSFNYEEVCLFQFWAKEEGRSFLTTQHLPFALFYDPDFEREKNREKIQGLCEYRMICKKQIYYLEDDTQKQQQQKQELLEGIPGRVFRNQCPEFSPNVEYYSPTEYPLLHHALRCKVRSSFAFPVFEPVGQTCVGVVEMVSAIKDPAVYDFLDRLPDSLEDVGLICSGGHFEQAMNETYEAAWMEVSKVLKVVRQVHKLRLAQIWVPYGICSALVDSQASTPLTNLIKIEHYIVMDSGDGDSDCDTNDFDATYLSQFCKFVYSRRERGVVGRAFLPCRLIYCTDVTQLSLDEYSLSHCAREYGFSGCFAICLQSRFTGAYAFVLEFFFPKSFKDSGDPWTSLKEILQTMREKCQSLKLFSGAELTEELPIEVIDFQNGEKLHYVSPLHELLKNGGMKQIVSSGQQSNDFQNVEIMDLVPSLPGHELFPDGGMRQDSSDQQYAINNRSIVDSVEPSNINVTRSEEKDTERIPQRESKKRGVKIAITRDEILQNLDKTVVDAANELGVSRSTLKRACREYGYKRWPTRERTKVGRPNESVPCGVDQEQIPQLNSDARSVTIKAKYEKKTIRFLLSSSSGMAELQHEVAKRLKLEGGAYCMEYKDEANDLVSITCDEDLQYFIHTYRSQCGTPLVIFLSQSNQI